MFDNLELLTRRYESKLLGNWQPDPDDYGFINGTVIPWGKTVRNPIVSNEIRFNEYRIASKDKALIKYIVSFQDNHIWDWICLLFIHIFIA